jgi:16S rRNA (guanine966-N2)-methyltransferase
MRVIAGQAHGRRLKAPRGLLTRPTSARVRESIFSRLQVRAGIEGARALDLFAGSGSLGCEALSRGAAEAVFVDSSRPAIEAIRSNLRALAMEPRGRIIAGDVFRAIDDLAAAGERFDLVFMDAPYKNDLSAPVLARIAAAGLLAEDGWVIVGQAKRAPAAPEAPAGLERINVAIIGDHRIAFYRRPPAAAPSEK